MTRQRNVQQQNIVTKSRIKQSAVHWRNNPVPEALRNCAKAKDVVLSESIVVDLNIDYPGMPNLFGLLLTREEQFIRFEIESERSHCDVISIDLWEDVTAEENLNSHNRGTGIGDGAIAIRVVHEVNSKGGNVK